MKYLFNKKILIVYGLCFLALIFAALSSYRGKLLASITQALVISEVNPERESLGLPALETNQKLTRAAQLKAEDMLARGYFSHIGPDRETPWSWLDKVGYSYVTAGENLAIDFSDASSLVDAWLASPSHARNIKKGYFNNVGIGVANGKMGDRNTTVVVMFLGRELPKEPPVLPASIEIEVLRSEKISPVNNITAPEEPVVARLAEEEKLEEIVLENNTSARGVAGSEVTLERQSFIAMGISNFLGAMLKLALFLPRLF